MPHVSEITIPIATPQVLKVTFNNTAYKKIKELTGVSVFEFQDMTKIQDPILLTAVLFAGTRKHHHNLDLENLNDWLDEVDTADLFKVYGEIIQALGASFLDPDKRAKFLTEVKVAKAKVKVDAKKVLTNSGTDTSSAA
jgi:hypothetical protein